jgi:HemY protein
MDKTSAELVASRIEELLAIGGPSPDDVAEPRSNAPAQEYADIIDADSVTVAPSRLTQNRAHDTPESTAAAAEPLKPVSTEAEAPTAPPAPAKIEAGPKTATSTVATPKPDAKIFVAPRAPDDPGLEEAQADNVSPLPRRPYRAVN